jgi:hypothetical protein
MDARHGRAAILEYRRALGVLHRAVDLAKAGASARERARSREISLQFQGGRKSDTVSFWADSEPFEILTAVDSQAKFRSAVIGRRTPLRRAATGRY